MTALITHRKTVTDAGRLATFPVAAGAVIYLGSLVCINAAGQAVAGADTAGLRFIGVAQTGADNGTGAAASLNVTVQQVGAFAFAAGSTLLQSAVGAPLYIADDQTLAYAADVTNQVLAGRQHTFSDAATAHLEPAPTGSGLAALSQPDTLTPAGEWKTSTTVDFAARDGQPAIVRVTLQDGIQRSFSGTLAWDDANGPADLGYDEAASQTGTDKIINWFVVPSSTNAALLTVVASDNAPTVGPTGYTNWKFIFAAYENTSALLRVFQSGNRFSYMLPVEPAAIAALTKTAFRDPGANYSIADTVPPSAVEVFLRTKIQQGNGATGGCQLELFPPSNPDTTTTTTTPSPKDIHWISTANVAYDTEYGVARIPIPGATKQIGLRVWNDSGGGGTTPLGFFVETLGWIDGLIAP